MLAVYARDWPDPWLAYAQRYMTLGRCGSIGERWASQ